MFRTMPTRIGGSGSSQLSALRPVTGILQRTVGAGDPLGLARLVPVRQVLHAPPVLDSPHARVQQGLYRGAGQSFDVDGSVDQRQS